MCVCVCVWKEKVEKAGVGSGVLKAPPLWKEARAHANAHLASRIDIESWVT